LRHPQNEEYWGNVNPIGERSCYDEGKRVAETLVMDYNRMHETDTAIVRIFNTYGPGMNPDDGRVMTNFITQTLRGEPMTIYGSGKQTRCFQYVDDTIEGLIRMMDSGLRGPINIGNPTEYTIKQLAKVVNPHGRIIHLPGTADDPKRRKPDIGLARSLLRWEPTVTLKDGIKEMMNYYNI